MLKNNKKVFFSLLATTLLASSVGHAESFNIKNISDYSLCNKSQPKRYTINYNYSKNNGNTTNSNCKSNVWQIINGQIQKPGGNTNTCKPGSTSDNCKPNTNKPDTNKPDTETPTSDAGSLSAVEMEVVRLVNIEREKAGLAPFTASSELSKVARVKSEDMAKNNYFSHTSPTYGDPFAMMKSFGIKYNTAGENIAKGYSSAQSVVNGWMNSPGHRANILNPRFNKIGVGLYKTSNGTAYWTQMFTN
ncbi:hypothetical protein KQI42_14660 [Tissierella sp. MSJ-40]|uniref:SCP domain-containing protein n=1 Tax=Tissierella simiarum TaxID=2841534 RepID=A0ABS6E8M1_9FIRM|nr:CAP domain-containing protein [Tissierella simiarum]MBU5439262.1 hypothetical protein [Tissierella simiarum]